MIKNILILGALLCSFASMAQNELKKSMYSGNIYYENKEYEDAAYYYEKAVENSPLNYKSNFNLGNTNFRIGDYEKAIEQFEKIVDLAPNKIDQSWTYHNLGNSYLLNQKLNDAIDAYKAALRLNPTDEETRYNLAYAQFIKEEQEKKKQEQEEQNENSGEDGEPQDGNEGDQNENGDEGEDGEKQNDDNQNGDNNDDQNGNDEGKEEERENNGDDSQESDQNNGDKQDGNQPNGERKYEPISKEQAKRILEAAGRSEKKVQENLDKEKVVGTGTSGNIDW